MTPNPEPRSEDDSRWLADLRSGDQNAANRLISKYQKPLVGFVLAHCSCSRDEAADLTQEIWIRTLPELGKDVASGGYDPHKGSFYTFLINRHARFMVLQYAERLRRRPESVAADDDDPAESLSPLIEAQDTAESALIKREELQQRLNALCECFRLTFLHGGYPHQVLAFGFSKLIYGQSTRRDAQPAAGQGKRKREIEGDPKRLDAERGQAALFADMDAFWHEYQRRSGLDQTTLDKLHEFLQPTRDRLPLSVNQMAAGNRVFLDHHAALETRVVGQTAFRDYYGSRGPNAITDWCDKVQNRVRDQLGVGRVR